METCYKVFRREVIQSIPIEENRFGFEPEITAKVASLRCRVYEVGISYMGRTYEEGKKIGWKDGFRALWCILKYNTWKKLKPRTPDGPAPTGSPPTTASGSPSSSGAGTVAYWALAFALTLLVALCTGRRDNVDEADAWEHHRAIKALVDGWPFPGNPTFATTETSIRYSPYSVSLAWLSRVTRLDPWTMLSGAAVFNTVLLVVALRGLLNAYGRASAGTCVLLMIVGLYGTAPGYANTLAVADLPWHQVNPSAFGIAVSVAAWMFFRRWAEPSRAPWIPLLLSVLLAAVLLSHAMTGIVLAVGLGAIALTAPTNSRGRLIIGSIAIVVVAAAISCLWPWYPFWRAVRSKPDNDYWFTPPIIRMMVTIWCAPAIVLSLAVLPLRRLELVRWGLVAAVTCGLLTVFAVLAKSPTLARTPLAGLIFLQIPLGVYAQEAGILRLSTWGDRLGRLVSRTPADSAGAAVETMTAAALVAFLVPQVFSIVREPHLARAYVAPLVRSENKQKPLKPLYEEVLRDVGARDVVLADDLTAWPVPSVRGRIVSAAHYEFFVSDQRDRSRDVAEFFSPDATDARRAEVVDRRGVRWILVNRKRQDARAVAALVTPSAVVRESGNLVLLDAAAWRRSRP